MKQVSSHYEKRLKEHSGVVSLHPPSTLVNETNPPPTWIVPLAAVSIGPGKPIELGITAKDPRAPGSGASRVFAAYLFLAVVP